MLFGLIACEDPEVTNPNDPNYILSQPTLLTAEPVSDSSIVLNWKDNEQFELGFRIECDSGSGFFELGTVLQDVTEYLDQGLTAGQSYTYRAAAYGLSDTTEFSNTATVIVPFIDFDGNMYQTVKIGNQVWMVENLKVTHYRDGTEIPNITDNDEWGGLTTGAYASYDNNESYAETYGYLYNWFAVNGDTDGDGVKDQEIAPEGWHVPTHEEWYELKSYLSNNGHSEVEGRALKSTTGWSSGIEGTDDYGFAALPGGYRHYSGEFFSDIGMGADFWSATNHSDSHAEHRSLSYYNSKILSVNEFMGYGFSIRLLRD